MDRKLKPRKKGVSYAKWGYIFILPFFIAYFIFTLTPQITTFYNSFFENYRSGLKQIGPNFVGFKNYISLFSPDKSGTIGMLKYFGNTMILWLMGAVPQIVVALMLAVVNVAATLYAPILTGDAIDLMIGKGKVDLDGLKPILAMFAVTIAIVALSQYVMNLCLNNAAYSALRDLRSKAFANYSRLPLSYIDSGS